MTYTLILSIMGILLALMCITTVALIINGNRSLDTEDDEPTDSVPDQDISFGINSIINQTLERRNNK